MWLAIVMFCMTPMDAKTCTLMVNNENLYADKVNCHKDMRDRVDSLFRKGIFAQGTCVSVGVSL